MIFGQSVSPHVSTCVAHACEGQHSGFPYQWADAGAPYRFAVYVFIAIVVVMWWVKTYRLDKRGSDDE